MLKNVCWTYTSDIDILWCELHLFENNFSKTALNCSGFFFFFKET